jgi:hypothetical protein
MEAAKSDKKLWAENFFYFFLPTAFVIFKANFYQEPFLMPIGKGALT